MFIQYRIILPAAVLLGVSLLMLSSISTHLFHLQLLWVGVGAAIFLASLFVDIRSLLSHDWLITAFYILCVFLLVVVLVAGPVIRNVRGWLVLGPITLQPVELAKVALILLYARYFSSRHMVIARFRTILVSAILLGIPALLTAAQPDLGSAVVLGGIWFGFLLVSGIPRRYLFGMAILAVVAAVFMWSYGFKNYQRERILGVIYPERDALGINYSTIQSKIAIGAGGWWGAGYKQGIQTQQGFLTEPANDFILAALVEEWGLVGAAVLIGAFAVLLYQILVTGLHSQWNVEKFICLGVVILFGLQFIINTGTATGLLPVIGVTFPLVSYGGSSLLANMTLLSLVHSVGRHG